MAQTLEHNGSLLVVTPIVVPTCDVDVDNIQQLDDEPNDVGGMTAEELKETFDKTGADIKSFINDDFIPAVLGDGLTEQARQEAEGERVANEQERVSNETDRDHAENGYTDESEVFHNGRVQNEQERVQAENARNVWETYDAAHSYVPGNKVAYDGSSYVCVTACTGIAPTDTDHWLLIAARGFPGSVVGAVPLDPDSSVVFSLGCDENGVYMVTQ